MRFNTRASSRALITGAVVSIGLLAGAAPASAHVRADADNPTPGSYSVVTFKVPNESEKGALTTQLSVTLPNVASASTEAMPGWSAKLDRDAAAGTVRSVTWTAAPGTGIAPERVAAVLAGAGGGIGLSNVDGRLRATYGERYALRIESQPGAGTTAVMTVPNLTGDTTQRELVSTAEGGV